MTTFVLMLFGPLYVAGAVTNGWQVYRWAARPWTTGTHIVAAGIALVWPLWLLLLLALAAVAQVSKVFGSGEQS